MKRGWVFLGGALLLWWGGFPGYVAADVPRYQVRVPSHCRAAAVNYWMTEFTWRDAYQKSLALLSGVTVCEGGCCVATRRKKMVDVIVPEEWLRKVPLMLLGRDVYLGVMPVESGTVANVTDAYNYLISDVVEDCIRGGTASISFNNRYKGTLEIQCQP